MNELSDKNRPQKLEDIFRNNMEEAEMAPSDNLWHRIEHDLDLQEKKYYQKQLIWFQRLAAACVLLLLFAGGYVLYDYQFAHEPTVATTTPAVNTPRNQNQLAVTAPPKPNISDKDKSVPHITAEKLPEKDSDNAPSKVKLTKGKKDNRNADYQNRTNHNKRKDRDSQPSEQRLTYLALGNVVAESDSAAVTVAATKESEVIAQPGFTFNSNDENTNQDESEISKSLPGIEVEALPMLALTSLLDTSALLKPDAPVTIATMPQPVVYAATTPTSGKQKAARWSFSGKYAPHYFNQHISLGQQGTGATAPGFNNTLLASNASASNFNQALNEFDNNIQSGYSFNTEGLATYKLNQNWALESGLAYTQNIASTETSYIFSNSQVSARYSRESLATNDAFYAHDNGSLVGVPATALVASLSGAANANASSIIQTQPFTTEYRYRLIGIPVKVNYQTNRNKSFYYASVGFLTNLLVQAHIISDSPRLPDLKYAPNADSPFRNWQMAAVASVGKGFQVSKNFSLKAGLEASQYLNTLADNPLYLEGQHRKPYTFGVALSSTYTVSK